MGKSLRVEMVCARVGDKGGKDLRNKLRDIEESIQESIQEGNEDEDAYIESDGVIWCEDKPRLMTANTDAEAFKYLKKYKKRMQDKGWPDLRALAPKSDQKVKDVGNSWRVVPVARKSYCSYVKPKYFSKNVAKGFGADHYIAIYHTSRDLTFTGKFKTLTEVKDAISKIKNVASCEVYGERVSKNGIECERVLVGYYPEETECFITPPSNYMPCPKKQEYYFYCEIDSNVNCWLGTFD